MIIAAVLITRWFHLKYEFDWLMKVIVFFISMGILSALFFRIKLLRYILSIGFSLCWAFVGYALLGMMTRSTTSPWVAAGFIFIITLFLHKEYFELERDAHRIDY
jgi:hypothetical protein